MTATQVGAGPTRATQIELASGNFIDLAWPDSRHIEIHDVAHALSLIARYNGHTKRFYSVAEHSILCFDLMRVLHPARTDLQRAALLHDAHEAYLGDAAYPLKVAMRQLSGGESVYDELAGRFDVAISERFGLWPGVLESAEVKKVDQWALAIETKRLMLSGGKGWIALADRHLMPYDGELPPEVAWSDRPLQPFSWVRAFVEVASGVGLR